MKTVHEEERTKNFIPESWYPKVKWAGNLLTSAIITTSAVMTIKMPSDFVLQQMTKKSASSVSASLKSWGAFCAMFTGLRKGILFSMPRSVYTLHSKKVSTAAKLENVESATVREQLEHNAETSTVREQLEQKTESSAIGEQIEHNVESGAAREQLENNARKNIKEVISRAATLGQYSLGEVIFTHIPDHKTALTQQDISYKNNLSNFATLTHTGVGIRFASAFINLSSITFIQQSYASLFPEKMKKGSWEPVTSFLSGALSGATAAVLTYPFKQLQTQIAVSAEAKEGQLHFKNTIQLMRENIQNFRNEPLFDFFKTVRPKLLLRCCQNSLVFAMITLTTHLLGETPAEDAYHKLSSTISTSNDENSSTKAKL